MGTEARVNGWDGGLALRCFGAAGHHYMEKDDATADLFARVAVKTRNHAALNPNALFTRELTEENVMGAPVLYMSYLTRLMCCPPTCGAGAAIICSQEFATRHAITGQVEIVGQAMTTDTPASWDICHPNAVEYPQQKLFIVAIDQYAYLVPYVETEDEVFLKTVISSRKFTNLYLRGDS